jgi:hypothetical protein
MTDAEWFSQWPEQAKRIEDDLRDGKIVTFQPRGHSMRPQINSGDSVTLEPWKPEVLDDAGEIVFCKVRGKYFLHRLDRFSGTDHCDITDNQGRYTGATTVANIFGRVINITPADKPLILAMADRIADQSEILSRRAEK